MTITARSITTNNTLEQLRNQFNNLVADVDGLETGTTAFSTITSTTSSSTTKDVFSFFAQPVKKRDTKKYINKIFKKFINM